MKILMLNMERGWRGGERQTLLSLQALREQGQQVALLARVGDTLAQRARAADIPVYEAANTLAVLRLLFKHRACFDVFHAQTANTLTALALLKPLLKGGVVFTRRTAFKVRKRERLTRWKWTRPHAFVCISEAAAAEPRRLGIDIAEIIPSAVVSQPPNHKNINTLKKTWALDQHKVLGTVAALTREKDPLTLVQAVACLYRERQDFVFLHFGGDGALKAQVQQQIQALGLQDCYRLLGFSEDISDCYRLLQGFVLSSTHEALGTSVLDAFLYRVPVAVTAAGGLPDLVAQNRGLLCPVADVACLQQAMRVLLDDTAHCTAMATHAYDYVVETHGVAAMAEQYLALYRRL